MQMLGSGQVGYLLPEAGGDDCGREAFAQHA